MACGQVALGVAVLQSVMWLHGMMLYCSAINLALLHLDSYENCSVLSDAVGGASQDIGAVDSCGVLHAAARSTRRASWGLQ